MRIVATRAPRVGEPGAEWEPLLRVPPGRYTVATSSRRPRAGSMEVRLAPSGSSLRVIPVSALSEQQFPLFLPAGAAALFLDPDSGLEPATTSIRVEPIAPGPRMSVYATRTARYGDVDLFFAGHSAVFIQRAGFWIRGGRAQRVTLAVSAERPTVLLRLKSGPVPNEVTVSWGPVRRQVTLRPDASEEVSVPVAADGTVTLEMSSASGYRPSETGGDPSDHRYLGVWVSVE